MPAGASRRAGALARKAGVLAALLTAAFWHPAGAQDIFPPPPSGQGAPAQPPAKTPAQALPAVPAAAVVDTPITEVREVRDPVAPLAIDLTVAHDDLWERLRRGFAMPDLHSPLVQDRQIWYAARPTSIKRMVERSRRYLYHIVEELEKRGMPTELALLPMVESAFNPMAYSRAHASGLWQFIPSTGKSYNLQQNWWYDARRDIIASTSAAMDYLQFLYDMHGDWHLALASYNWGENAVARAIERNRRAGLPTDYLSLSMPTETRYYVPKLQALKNILANPAAFGIDMDPIPNQPYFVTVSKTKDIDIRTAAKLADMSVEELIALNPAYNRPVITSAQSQTLVLPADRAELFAANLESHDKPLSAWQTYTLRSGDKLDKVAATYGITLARLRQVNGITGKTKVGPGMQVLVPVKGASAEPLPTLFQPPAATVPVRAQARTRELFHTVQKGDTLPSIAQRYKVSVDDLRRWNQIGRLAAGQKLKIEVNVPAPRASTGSTARPGHKAQARRATATKRTTAKRAPAKPAAKKTAR